MFVCHGLSVWSSKMEYQKMKICFELWHLAIYILMLFSWYEPFVIMFDINCILLTITVWETWDMLNDEEKE